MSVYNAENDLKESIESILSQTFSDFEFIIVNDGSTDQTKDIIEKYADQDPRITILNQKNTGLTKALNNGIEIAKGEYIARQDADDVSYPERFQKQLNLIQSNSSIVLVGGNCDDLYPNGYKGEWGAFTAKELQKIVYMRTPFAHSTVLMRTNICRDLKGYNESFKTSQDMEFWMRFAKRGKLEMVAEPILLRKIVSDSISQKRRWRQFYDAYRARWRHNQRFGRARALYFGLRSLVIGLLPAACIKTLKGYLKS